MQLITVGFTSNTSNLIFKTQYGVGIVERWLYAGGMKKFLSNLYRRNFHAPFIISVVELGEINDAEKEAMQKDGFKFMPLEDYDTLYV
jgi:hypothetical protein